MRAPADWCRDLAALTCHTRAAMRYPDRQPWLQPPVASILASLDTDSLADLAWAAIAAACNHDHKTPAGIRFELERLSARRAEAAGRPATPTLPTWQPEQRTDLATPDQIRAHRERLRQALRNRQETS
ncbi:hypothetical protein ACTND8_05915 [Atopobiaceae bacterium HCP3S3_F7]